MERITIPRLAKEVPDEASAYLFMEKLRWNGTPVCPHCGCDKSYYIRPLNGTTRTTRTGSESPRRVHKCAGCRKQFSVLTGTIFHGTKIPVRTWLFVVVEICASKNGVSAREIQRKYELTPKTAWFMMHRLREAMKRDQFIGLMKGTIIADESYVGGKSRNKYGTIRGEKPVKHIPEKAVVFTLIDEATGEARSRVIPDVKADTLAKAIGQQVAYRESKLVTDELGGYKLLGRRFGNGHETVTHSAGEYVRADGVTTNKVENYFGQLKRSVDGTFHHVSHVHLDRYLAEFDFRYSTRKLTDTQRVARLMGQVAGRRLTYRPMIGG